MEIIGRFNLENISEHESRSFKKRVAVRIVVLDTSNNVALLYSAKDNHYGLPGGGVDYNESAEEASIRECKEEIGCDVIVDKELGQTLEYRKGFQQINQSYGFVARVYGGKSIPIPTGDEIERQVTVVWVLLSEAIALLEKHSVLKDLYLQQVIQRDLTFLRRAKALYTSLS